MRTLVRLVGLANGRYAVQVKVLEPNRHATSTDWLTRADFSSEQAAELFARGIADRSETPAKQAYQKKAYGGPHQRSNCWWLWPNRDCRLPI